MKCKKCKVEMQMQVVSETKEKTLAEKMSHAGKVMTFGIGSILVRHEKEQPVIAVTYAVCPKCGNKEKVEDKKGIFGRG